MKILQQIRYTIVISVIHMLLFSAGPVLAQDSEFFRPDSLIASVGIPSGQMSISYHGNTLGVRPVLSDTSCEQAIPYETGADEKLFNGAKTKYERVGNKIKSLTRHALRYFYFDQSDVQDTKTLLSLKTRVHANEYAPDDMDIKVSVNVGVNDETNDFTINELKVSSFGFSTYLDTVYDYRKDRINLYLSNMYLNALLLKGMKLEFQVHPKESSGAVVLNMNF